MKLERKTELMVIKNWQMIFVQALTFGVKYMHVKMCYLYITLVYINGDVQESLAMHVRDTSFFLLFCFSSSFIQS
jgi:hypothetical protein